jgi:pyruvate dehydrogenase E1 component beta subunit
MEHKNLWGLRSEVPDGEEVGELGRARLVRAGGDITLVSWSAMVHEAAKAVELAAGEGIAVELIDLRTLWPWDEEAVLASVGKTGRLLVVHEAVTVAGFGSEIAATVAEELFEQLKAPVRRLGAPRVPVGYAPSLEDQVKILAERDILPTICALVGKQR